MFIPIVLVSLFTISVLVFFIEHTTRQEKKFLMKLIFGAVSITGIVNLFM